VHEYDRRRFEAHACARICPFDALDRSMPLSIKHMHIWYVYENKCMTVWTEAAFVQAHMTSPLTAFVPRHMELIPEYKPILWIISMGLSIANILSRQITHRNSRILPSLPY
jgi:hypothetical protein